MDSWEDRQTVETLWERYFRDLSTEEWLTAKALLECDPHRVVARDAERWITDPHIEGYRDDLGRWVWELKLDWHAWIADVEKRGRAWSDTEQRLFQLVAALVTTRPIRLAGVLDQLGPWEADVWRILTEWGTGGDNRGRLGRSTSVRRSQLS